MFDTSQNWELFGFDMRNLGRHWAEAWRELLFAADSPVRLRLDDVVCLHTTGGITYYQAGSPCDVAEARYVAYLLPEELVLSKSLSLPAAVEVDLAAALALEVNAYSPFSAADTCYGWTIIGRSATRINLLLVIISRSAAAAFLGQHFGIHDLRQVELWVKQGSEIVVVRGFGESGREQNYKKRLLRVAAMATVGAILILSVAGVAAGFKALELKEMKAMAAAVERDSAEAARYRSALALANETIVSVNKIAAKYPSPHREIGRLTHLLGDGESVDQFSMNGLEINVRGRAADAASVMQRLTDQTEYAVVTAPRAFAREKNTQAEQFYLTIQMRERSVP